MKGRSFQYMSGAVDEGKTKKNTSGLKYFNPVFLNKSRIIINNYIRMSEILGRKIGMTSLFDENGKNIPCTVSEAGPCVVTQVRTLEVDGYKALQLGFDDKTAKSSNKALDGHFKKAGTIAKKKVIEFQEFEDVHK